MFATALATGSSFFVVDFRKNQISLWGFVKIFWVQWFHVWLSPCKQRSERNTFDSMKIHTLLTVLFFCFLSATAQNSETAKRIEYIEKNASLAQKEMALFGIPASITLAQGILESGDGQGKLAIEGNNHFGIKCHPEWTGPSVVLDDDLPNECFRAYGSVAESYRDHSLFLRDRHRYEGLFRLPVDDYRAWAHGLQQAGYATHPAYAERLIALIENNELDRWDRVKSKTARMKRKEFKEGAPRVNNVPVYYSSSETNWAELSRETRIPVRMLLSFNDAFWHTPVHANQPIYLSSKKSRSSKEYDTHTWVVGDDIYRISQRYGIKIKSLYNRNGWEAGDQPGPGTVIVLR